jgi:hypothetical protein
MKQSPFGKFQQEKGSHKKNVSARKKQARQEKRAYFERRKLEESHATAGEQRPKRASSGTQAAVPVTGTAAKKAVIKKSPGAKSRQAAATSAPMPLNKFIAHAGNLFPPRCRYAGKRGK